MLNVIGIDASNIMCGGALTHLQELLSEVVPSVHGFSQIVIWASRSTLIQIDDRSWIIKRHDPLLEKSILHRVWWQRKYLGKLLKAEYCDLLFVPGGSFVTDFRPVVTMSRNMLPFEWREMRRYSFSLLFLKILFLRYAQSNSFRKADGLIFLTQYAKKEVLRVIGKSLGLTTIIPHGIDQRFFSSPKPQKRSEDFNDVTPCHILYVSHVGQYKHQWNVAEAIAQLRNNGLKVRLDLVGPNGNAFDRLLKTLKRVDPTGAFIFFHGQVPYEELHDIYRAADINIFASSCENMPNILLESMASGLPIACSKCGPMPEILGGSGIYFDPEKPEDIVGAVLTLMKSQELRTKMAKGAFEQAQNFSWHRCTEETFLFLNKVFQNFLRDK